MANTDFPHLPPSVQRAWLWLVFLGAVLLLGGILLLAAPVAGGLVVTTWIGIVFLIGGIAQTVHAFMSRGWQSGFWQWASGLLYILGGVVVLFDPLAGAVALTVVLAAIFLVDGAFRLALGMRVRPHDGWIWIALGGVVSIVAGLFIFVYVGSAPASLVLLGTIAGISFLFEGGAFLALGFVARRLFKTSP